MPEVMKPWPSRISPARASDTITLHYPWELPVSFTALAWQSYPCEIHTSCCLYNVLFINVLTSLYSTPHGVRWCPVAYPFLLGVMSSCIRVSARSDVQLHACRYSSQFSGEHSRSVIDHWYGFKHRMAQTIVKVQPKAKLVKFDNFETQLNQIQTNEFVCRILWAKQKFFDDTRKCLPRGTFCLLFWVCWFLEKNKHESCEFQYCQCKCHLNDNKCWLSSCVSGSTTRRSSTDTSYQMRFLTSHFHLFRTSHFHIFFFNFKRHNVKRRSYPCNRPWRPIGLWEVETPTFSRHSAHRWR
jgi:hypothetical protein